MKDKDNSQSGKPGAQSDSKKDSQAESLDGGAQNGSQSSGYQSGSYGSDSQTEATSNHYLPLNESPGGGRSDSDF